MLENIVCPMWEKYSRVIVCLALLTFICPPSISSQTQPATTNSSTCRKCNNGNSLTSLIVKEPKPECLSGHFFALVRNASSCECDFLCARTSGQSCYSAVVGNNQSLCDTTLRLSCDSVTASCLGALSLSISNVRHDSVYVYWNSLSNVSRSHSSIFIAPHNSHFPNGVSFQLVNASIFNFGARQLAAKLVNLKENTIYMVKVVVEGREEFIVTKTIESELSEPLPNVIVTNKKADSISIAFDDFKPPNYDAGYVIHYRCARCLDSSWKTIQSNNTPVYKIGHLEPYTLYQIQVFIWDHRGDKIGTSSDIVSATTLEGCFHNDTVYNVGQKMVDTCDIQCICVDLHAYDCMDKPAKNKCAAPSISAKEAAERNLLNCTAVNKCCVNCRSTPTPPPASTSLPSFVDKPGLCAPVPPTPCTSSVNVSECVHDYHCAGISKCCASGCGKHSCQSPHNTSLVNVNNTEPCSLECGENSVCERLASTGYECVCAQGYVGGDGGGCVAKSNLNHANVKKHECEMNNATYSIGQHFELECKHCVCSEALEVECTPTRCDCANHTQQANDCCGRVCQHSHDAIAQHELNRTTIDAANHTVWDNCVHLNQTIAMNATFHIGCDQRCVCKARGELECKPRCADNPGYDQRWCTLVQDPDDECCKISVCDHTNTTMPVLPKPEILIEMAEAINSSCIKLKLLHDSSSDPSKGELHYVQMFANMTEHDPSKLDWTILNASHLAMRAADTNNSVEIVLQDLQAQSDYFILYKIGMLVSNIVIVRTFPPGIDHTYKGCFHGNQILKVGEVFYEGECEYKCTCHQDGIRECEERCPRYKDLIGYQHCRWQQSAEDPCCSEPVCEPEEEEDEGAHMPTKQCVTEDRKVFQIGESWILGNGCHKKKCECHLNREQNVAEIKCQGGCPHIPEAVLKPNRDCASPRLIKPEDACICPYVVCSDNINPLDLPEKPEKSSALASFCQFKGSRIAVDETFYDNCRAVCRCEQGGVLDCKPITCQSKFGPLATPGCLEWQIDANFVPTPPNCCPEPRCKNDGSCSFAGIRFPNHKQIPQELLPCGKRCMCQNGQINCSNMCPEISDTPPLGLNCPPAFAFRGHLPGDNCCIFWQCRNVYQDKMKGNCLYKDKRYKLGEQWDELDTGIKRRCECRLSSGIMHISCNPGNCEPLTSKYLEPSAECAIPSVVIPPDPVMCPYVICNKTGTEGNELLQSVDVIAINSTSARIRFTMPALYVGLLGHAEVHYTTDLNIPRHQWNIQKFARPKRLFDIPNIEYHLGNLKPDTTYFLQIEIIIEALKSGPASEIYKLYLPSKPTAVKESSGMVTTSTSTLPPIIMLDMNLSSDLIEPTSAKLSWRAFTTQEKKFIDGIQIRYKISNSDEDNWSHSPVLHRNTTQYVLHNLRAGESYVFDLLFTSIENVRSNIVSSKPVVFEIPAQAEDKSDLHVFPDDVVVNEDQVEIVLSNVTKALDKYINVAKLYYQDLNNMKLMHKYISIDDPGKISFSNLQSNTRYKMWMDLYLSNGQVVSTNSFNVMTNAALLQSSSSVSDSRYIVTFVIISLIVFFTGAFFMLTTCYAIRRNNNAAINRARISHAAYDNPTYKTFEANGKCDQANTNNPAMAIANRESAT